MSEGQIQHLAAGVVTNLRVVSSVPPVMSQRAQVPVLLVQCYVD